MVHVVASASPVNLIGGLAKTAWLRTVYHPTPNDLYILPRDGIVISDFFGTVNGNDAFFVGNFGCTTDMASLAIAASLWLVDYWTISIASIKSRNFFKPPTSRITPSISLVCSKPPMVLTVSATALTF